VLAGPIGCDRPYVMEALLEASTRLPAEQRRSVIAAQQPSFREFLSTQVLNATPACADLRSAVIDMADINAAAGDSAGEKAVLDQAIDSARQRLGGNLASDRNLADNLRVYLSRAKRAAELDTLQHELIAAYPDDYVFAYRYGRSLVDAGKPAEALPYLEQAAGKAYGANRFTVASVRVKALKALNRQADADKLVASTVAENGKLFPDQADRLKASLKS
jgi:predicted Zn-dependent protease